jgi:hypothetical protein
VLWAKSAGGTYSDEGTSLATDASGNVYITGNFVSPTITFGTTILTNESNNGGSDIFIAKYDAFGTVLWAKSEGGTYFDEGTSVATDVNGNVFVTGNFNSDTITFGTNTCTNAGSNDIFIAKYDATGTVLWAKSSGTPNYDRGRSVSTDTNGNVYVTGMFNGAAITFGTTILTNASNNGYNDIFIAKYDAAGTVLWAKSEGGIKGDEGTSLATDANANVYLTGYFQSATITFGTTSLTNAGELDIFIVKYAGILTGVNEVFGNNELNLYPNPTNSTITLTIPKLIKANITITNLTGKQVATYNVQNTCTKTIDTSQLAEGVYFVSLKSDDGVLTKKLVKTN